MDSRSSASSSLASGRPNRIAPAAGDDQSWPTGSGSMAAGRAVDGPRAGVAEVTASRGDADPARVAPAGRPRRGSGRPPRVRGHRSLAGRSTGPTSRDCADVIASRPNATPAAWASARPTCRDASPAAHKRDQADPRGDACARPARSRHRSRRGRASIVSSGGARRRAELDRIHASNVGTGPRGNGRVGAASKPLNNRSTISRRAVRVADPVADARLGDDQPARSAARVGRIELAPQPADVDVEVVRLVGIRRAPHRAQQPALGQQAPGLARP